MRDGRPRIATIAAAALVGLGGCGAPHGSPMYPAGSDKDDGYGDLARASARFYTSDKPDAPLFPPHHHRSRVVGAPDGDPYAGSSDVDADESHDTGEVCANRHCPRRPAHYNAVTGLTGAIEGTITWQGAPPAPLATACGSIDSPVRVGADRAVGGILVYIERVDIGRALPSHGRPSSVGGVVAKRGCALVPAVQIVTPLPASLAVHGDASQIALRVTTPSGVRSLQLEEAGHAVLPAQLGITRIDAADGSLASAWIIASETPYYAITDDRGRFRIDELAAGSYELTFWRPPLPRVANGQLVYGEPAITRRSIRVDPAHPAHLDVSLDR